MSGPAAAFLGKSERRAAEPNQPGKEEPFELATPETNPMPSRSNTAPKKTAPSAPEPLPNSPSTQQWNDGGP